MWSRLTPALLLVAACGTGGANAPTPGQLVATWTGGDTGAGRLAAQASYCSRDSTLEILAHQGDRGVGVSLYLPSREPLAGQYTFVHPETPFIPRPGATGAYRFLTERALFAFVSRSGEVNLTEVGAAGVSGDLTLSLTSLDGPDTVLVRGTFYRVPLDSTLAPCGVVPPKKAEVF